MIIQLFVEVLVSILTFILNLLPNIPAMPQELVDIGDFIVRFFSGMFTFVNHIYTPILVGVIVGLLILILLFNQSAALIFWVLRKLKIVS